MNPAFSRVDHRPWPVPVLPWIGRQTWNDLLFAHWPVASASVRALVPEELTVQEFDGTSWIGVVPFHMTGVTGRLMPSIPGFSAFPELNVRLYVERAGRPGVWFLSLDAENAAAVWAARRFFHLPYFRAAMAVHPDGDGVRYDSQRVDGTPVRFRARYRASSPIFEPKPGTLDHFLTERYCLYAQAPDGSLRTVDIQHPPWPLQKAEIDLELNDMARPHGLLLEGPPPVLHFAKQQHMVHWAPRRV